jgi:hypothetical protein
MAAFPDFPENLTFREQVAGWPMWWWPSCYYTIGQMCATQHQQIYHRAVNISLKLNLSVCDRPMIKLMLLGGTLFTNCVIWPWCDFWLCPQFSSPTVIFSPLFIIPRLPYLLTHSSEEHHLTDVQSVCFNNFLSLFFLARLPMLTASTLLVFGFWTLTLLTPHFLCIHAPYYY